MRRARVGSLRPDRMSLAEILLLGSENAPGERLTGAGRGLVSRDPLFDPVGQDT